MRYSHSSPSSRGKSFMLSLLSVASILPFTPLAYAQIDDTQAKPVLDQFSVAARCPLSCGREGNWALYSGIDDLESCNKTVLLELNLYTPISDENSAIGIRSCAVDSGAAKLKARQDFVVSNANNTPSIFDKEQQTGDIQILQQTGVSSDAGSVQSALVALANYLRSEKDGTSTALFAKTGDVIVGVYGGLQVEKQSLSSLVQDLTKHIDARNLGQATAQYCKDDSLNTQIFGVFLDTTGDLAAAQKALRSWNEAECISGSWDSVTKWQGASISMIPGSDILVVPATSRNETVARRGNIIQRATCSYTQAVAGDGCWALADRCKITQAKLVEFSGNSNLCNAIQVNQYYCCSAGTLPDFSPQPNADGTCKTHPVASTDICDTISKKYSMTVKQLQDRNKNTWGWQGCQFLMKDQLLCISTGAPPMPAVDPLATCGPTVAGTQKPSDMSKINELNPCPLKACCNVWGNCGISKDFCILNPADTKAPGTTQPGANSCVASCGMEITNNGAAPSSFMRVGYFEAFNLERPCLHMLPRHINTNYYTHIHFAFGDISTSFGVQLGKLQPMFEEFKKLTGVKKIMSFGGWSFSTEADTYPIFREGVTAAQRATFANNVVQFAADNNLDGLDFDWEYPGAPDIPGIPPGSINDGPNYLEFLKAVRRRLPQGKTIGIAAPASFWYLKGFPIEEMAKVVDYIIYMTYDLHGQWDYGNKWSTDGCVKGDCLRHHTNRTETELALVMATKAGVPANKIIVGMPLYGRSFKMTSPGCTGPMCTYVGKESAAAPGRCTGTRGYISNFEIRELMASKNVQQLKTAEGDEIMVYDGTEYVGYMTKQKYNERSSWIKGLNFGGTSDWAIDLDGDYDIGSGPGGGAGVSTVLGGTTSVIGGVTSVNNGVTTVIGGSTTVIGGITTTLSPTTTVVDGTTTVINGVTTVVGGVTLTLPPGPITTVVGGTTTVIDGKTTVIGGTSTTFNPGVVTTVIGGTTTVVNGRTTVIGGVTTTVPPGGLPTATGVPTVTNGRCTGRDCVNGRCVGILCASFGCSGRDCTNGVCTGLDCIPLGCMGPNCADGVCKDRGCLNGGCIGSDCEGGGGGGGGTGHCFGLNCLSLGCAGLDCGPNGVCFGINCSSRSCTGLNCFSGTCAGSSCTAFGGATGGGGNAPDDGKDPKSCSTSSRYRTCTTKLIVSKTVFPDADSTATTTSTSSTCYTVTACTGSQSAFTTTTQTTTTVEDLCAPTACGNACGPVKRNMGVIPTAVPQLDDSGVLHIGSMSSNSALAKRAISKRDIPLDDTGDWANYYRTLKADPNTFVIDNYAQTGGTLASWVRYKWGNSPINVIVQDLYGCIAVIAVSQLGVFVGHFWEKNSVIVPDRFLIDVIGTLQSNFDPSSDTSKEYFGPSTRFYIMAGTAKSTVTNGPDDIASLGRSDPAGPFRAQQVESIKRLLSVYSDDIIVYTYLRQRDETIREQGGWGRAAVSFHPAQSTFPGGPFLPGTALVKVVLQGTPLENRFWPYVQIDVWRVNSGGKATNVAKQVAAGQVINPCNDLNQVASTETVTLGSENVGVGRSQPFAILQSNGVVLQGGGNCAFSGGPYAPDRSSGLIAGQFTCDSGTPVLRDCFRPTNNLATTCGRGAASGCGKLGQNCNDYYQLVASCRV